MYMQLHSYNTNGRLKFDDFERITVKTSHTWGLEYWLL